MRGLPSTCGMIFQQIVRPRQRLEHRLGVERHVLEAHRAGGDPHGPVVERPDQRVLVGGERGLGVLLREAPKLAPAVDRWPVVQEHGMGVAAFFTLVFDGNDLAGLGVVAEPGRVRHADELELHDRLIERQGLRNDGFQSASVGPVGDDQELAIDEPIWPWGKSRARQRHGEGALLYLVDLHLGAPAGTGGGVSLAAPSHIAIALSRRRTGSSSAS